VRFVPILPTFRSSAAVAVPPVRCIGPRGGTALQRPLV